MFFFLFMFCFGLVCSGALPFVVRVLTNTTRVVPRQAVAMAVERAAGGQGADAGVPSSVPPPPAHAPPPGAHYRGPSHASSQVGAAAGGFATLPGFSASAVARGGARGRHGESESEGLGGGAGGGAGGGGGGGGVGGGVGGVGGGHVPPSSMLLTGSADDFAAMERRAQQEASTEAAAQEAQARALAFQRAWGADVALSLGASGGGAGAAAAAPAFMAPAGSSPHAPAGEYAPGGVGGSGGGARFASPSYDGAGAGAGAGAGQWQPQAPSRVYGVQYDEEEEEARPAQFGGGGGGGIPAPAGGYYGAPANAGGHTGHHFTPPDRVPLPPYRGNADGAPARFGFGGEAGRAGDGDGGGGGGGGGGRVGAAAPPAAPSYHQERHGMSHYHYQAAVPPPAVPARREAVGHGMSRVARGPSGPAGGGTGASSMRSQRTATSSSAGGKKSAARGVGPTKSARRSMEVCRVVCWLGLAAAFHCVGTDGS